jgi:hypothetical protein
MSSYGFTSAFATELDAYLAFKANMGFFGTSRIWYLNKFDTYCSEHNRTVFERTPSKDGSVSSWKVRAATGPGCPTSATSAGGCRRTGPTTPMCSPTVGKPRSLPLAPTC